MLYLELFWAFLKVGLFSFGGAYAAIPLIREVVSSYGWVSDEMLANMIAVSESTPGPIMVNVATYVGSVRGGVLGAAVATFATVLPAFVIIILVCAFLKKFLEKPAVQSALSGLKASVIGIIFAVGLVMMINNLFPAGVFAPSFAWQPVTLTAALGIGWFLIKYLWKKKPSPIIFILISAALGIGIYWK